MDSFVIGQIPDITEPIVGLFRIAGMAILSAVVTAIVAIGYRWYSRMRIPANFSVIIGLSAVALWLNTLRALSQYIDPIEEPFTIEVAVINIGAFVAAGIAAGIGGRAGDRLATGTASRFGSRSRSADISPIVGAVGRTISVTIPGEIDDIEGYDPVDSAVKTDLAGRTLLFPRGLTVEELRERLGDRLKSDFEVGHVDVEVTATGTIEYLAVGTRASGLGPTLPPGMVATAVRADPPTEASPGDAIQLWRGGDGAERVATGELRGTAGDTVTVAIDESDVAVLSSDEAYRLITVSTDTRPDREFATMLRSADETMGVIEVGPDSPLVGRGIETLDVAVIAIRDQTDAIIGVPARSRELSPGDTIYVVATPEAIRRL